MELLKLILDVLKFGAIAVGSISGLIGTLTETKDKESGKPTPWGKRIVALIVISGIIAMTTQSIEIYLKHRSDLKDADDRIEAAKKTSAILDKANQTADGIEATKTRQDKLLQDLQENVEKTDKLREKAEELGVELKGQRESIAKTATGIGQTARNLTSVLSAQHQTLTEMYRQVHPLEELQVKLSIEYPILPGDGGFENEWLAKIRASAASKIPPSVQLGEPDPLNPSPDQHPRAFALLKQPRFGIFFNLKPSSQLIDRGQDLEFQTHSPPEYILLTVDLDKRIISQIVNASTEPVLDNRKITSLLDLYGAEIIIVLPNTSPIGSRIITCTLLFPFGTGNGKIISLRLNDSERRENPFNKSVPNIAYVKVLSEKDLGPKPDILK